MKEFVISIVLYSLVAWAANLMLLVSLTPQIVSNYRRQSVEGLSPFMMWALWNGYVLNAIYVSGQPMPLAYKVCSPLWLVLATVLLLQKIYYTPGNWWTWLYAGNAAALAAFFVMSLSFPLLCVGAGW